MEFKNKKEFVKYLLTLDFGKLPQAYQDEVSKFLEEEAVSKARSDFYTYVKLIGPRLVDGFETGRHMEKICIELQDLAERMWGSTGLTVRKMISLPPGASKSQLCSRLFPSWVLGRWPKCRIIIVGHGIDFARDEYGSKVKDIIKTDEYQKIFPSLHLRPDKQTQGRFLTTHGGELMCGSLEAKIAGRRAHLVICDDALVEDDALSKDVCAKIVSKYMPNVRSRLLTKPDCAELCVGTRWCIGDLFDYLENEDKHSEAPWDVIKIPAILDEQASEFLRKKGDPDGYLTPGTSFWPEFQSTRKLEMIRASYLNNMSRWNATYMQNPVPQDGQLLNADDFKKWDSPIPPECSLMVLTADTAYTKNTHSDFSAFQLWGFFPYEGKPNAILLDARKGKWDFPELSSMFERLYYRHRPDVILVEYKASGLAIVPELRKRGLPVAEFKTTKDKMERMQAAAPLVKSGLFWVPFYTEDTELTAKSMEFINELVMFPAGRHDDVADAFSQFVLYARDNNLLSGEQYVEQAEMYDEEEEENYSMGYTAALLRR